jgi:hypothetical protein
MNGISFITRAYLHIDRRSPYCHCQPLSHNASGVEAWKGKFLKFSSLGGTQTSGRRFRHHFMSLHETSKRKTIPLITQIASLTDEIRGKTNSPVLPCKSPSSVPDTISAIAKLVYFPIVARAISTLHQQLVKQTRECLVDNVAHHFLRPHVYPLDERLYISR